MKNESTGGRAAEDTADRIVEERLSRRFEAELERAERDYPTLGGRRRDASSLPERPRRGLMSPRLAVPIVAVAVLVFGGLVGFGLIGRSGGTTAGPGGPAAALGADGIPNQIDGKRVYRVGDQAAWQDIKGTFLLGGYVFKDASDCTNSTSSESGLADSGFMPACGGYGLGPTAGSDTATGGLNLGNPDDRVLGGWLGEPVVALVKTCTYDDGKTRCPSMVSQVVWPAIPDAISGERVYRATDSLNFPAGSFLLGGRFTKPTVVPPCPAPIDKSAVEQQLIPYCFIQTIDGLQLAPMSTIDEPNDEVVVARVHVNDPLAAQCPAATLADCQASIVVESVVWRSGELLVGQPSPAESATGAIASGVVAAPSGGPPIDILASPTPVVGSLDADGVPTDIDGQVVYRPASLPDSEAFLLGGILGRQITCAPASAMQSIPPECQTWTIDGLAVGNIDGMPAELIGVPIVVDVVRGAAACPSDSCQVAPNGFLSSLVVWTGPLPPPAVPSAHLPAASSTAS